MNSFARYLNRGKGGNKERAENLCGLDNLMLVLVLVPVLELVVGPEMRAMPGKDDVLSEELGGNVVEPCW